VLVAGGLDLSVGAIYGLATVVSGEVAEHHSAWIAIAAALLVGLGVGLVNGMIVAFLKDQSAHRDIGNVICHKWGRAEGVQWQPHRALPKLCVL